MTKGEEDNKSAHLTNLLNSVRIWKPRDRIPGRRRLSRFEHFKPPIPTRIVVFGKSGCGKSSLLNSLFWVAKFRGSNSPPIFQGIVPSSHASMGGNTARLLKLNVLENMEFVDSRGYTSTDDDTCNLIKMICKGFGRFDEDMEWRRISLWQRVFNQLSLGLCQSTRKMDFAVLVVSAKNPDIHECKPIIKAIKDGTGCAPLIVVTSKDNIEQQDNQDGEKEMHGKVTGIGALRALFVENYVNSPYDVDIEQHTKLCEVLRTIQLDYDHHLNGLDEHYYRYPFLKLSLLLIFILMLVLCLTGRPNIIYRGTPRDCTDINGLTAVSGMYTIKPDDGEKFNVYCDMITDGGGWTVFQRRHDGSEDFYNTWVKYKSGFGDITSEHWLGNEKIHRLTATRRHELRVDLASFDNENRFAQYDYFVVGNETSGYRLNLGRYSGGDAGDSLEFHNGNSFSTKDKNNILFQDRKDPQKYEGAWWFSRGHFSHLNGKYLTGGKTKGGGIGITWNHFKGNSYSLKSSEMKIRRIDLLRYLIEKVHDICLLGKNFTLINLFV